MTNKKDRLVHYLAMTKEAEKDKEDKKRKGINDEKVDCYSGAVDDAVHCMVGYNVCP